MLNRLRRISRRIGGWVTASKLAGKTAGKTAAKKADKTNGKKPLAKTAEKVAEKSKGAASKAASKPTGKAAGKASVKPQAKVAAKPIKAASAEKPVTRQNVAKLKPVARQKPVAKLKPEAKTAHPVVEKVPLKAAASESQTKKGKLSKVSPVEIEEPTPLEPDLNSDFEEMELSDVNLAADLAAVEVEPVEVSPSAGLLAIMKPTSPDAEKSGEKKKKKDDLKLDRGGDLEAQWTQIKEKNKALKALPYKMSESFEARTPILHKVLGWGFIISNQNDRLEVLFQQGIKFLISNYKT